MANQQLYILILAAGASSRMGQPKQLLPYQDEPLIRHLVKMSLQTHQRVLVVIGALHEKIAESLKDLPVQTVVNSAWKNGLSASLQCGVKQALVQDPQIQGVLVVLGDQPLITATHLKNLIKQGNSEEGTLVATDYGDMLGVPAYIGKRYFPDIMQLSGDAGARSIMGQYPQALRKVLFPGAKIDLDTREDWTEFIKGPNAS